MEEIWQKLCIRMSEKVSDAVFSRLTGALDKYLRSSVKIVYSEKEAAAWFGVSIETLQGWRHRKLISYSQYPVGRLRPSDKSDRLTSIFVYNIADMLSFCDRYKVRTTSADIYMINPEVSVFGPEVKSLRQVA